MDACADSAPGRRSQARDDHMPTVLGRQQKAQEGSNVIGEAEHQMLASQARRAS